MSFHIVPLLPKATAGKARQRRTSASDRAREKWAGSGRCRDGATRGAQSHRRLRGICAASRYFAKPCMSIYYLCWNETERNETVNAVFLESCALLPFRFYGFLCKPNDIVLNDIGNVFLTRTVYGIKLLSRKPALENNASFRRVG